MAIHFDFNGNPDSYASRFFASFLIPLFMLCVHIVVWIVKESDPKRNNVAVALRRISKWMIPIISLAVHSVSIAYAIGITIDLNFYVMLLLGVVFVMFGNYLPKCRQNYTVGIKLPWTLGDEDNWNKTHRLAGYLWVAGGVVMFINAFVNSGIVLAGTIISITVVPGIFSYLFYVRRQNGN